MSHIQSSADGPQRYTRSTALLASVVLAALLNAGALAFVTRLETTAAVAPNSPKSIGGRLAVQLLPMRPAAVAPPERTVPAAGPVAAPTPAAALPQPAPAPTPTATPPPAFVDMPSPNLPTVEAPGPVRFYTYDEVESPAAPTADWALDAAALDNIGVTRLVFEILVNERGDVLMCSVLEPAELAAETRQNLEQRLAETVLQPAIRAGRLVASMRRIELTVE